MTCAALVLGAAATASAEVLMTSLKTPLVFETAESRPLRGSAALAAAQPGTTATNPTNNHQFGLGVRVYGDQAGIGASARYFFYGGPLGVQAELSRHGIDLGRNDFSTVRFSPSVIYRFVEIKFDSPVSITPYVGGGLAFVHSRFDDDFRDEFDDIFDEDLDDDTDVGVLVFGGVEFFFSNLPNLGASAELTFNSVEDRTFGPFEASLGGPSFTAAAHWYFW